MKKTKAQKGITLIALIITVVILMILAAVAINSITNEGIISKTEDTTDKFKQEQEKEKDVLDYYEDLIEGKVKYVKDVQEQVLSTTQNTNVYDKYGNKIVLPAGFMITKDAATVEEGIVIQDGTKDANGNPTATNGSQFVWIPVGKVNSSKGTKTITLGRYVFADGDTDYNGDGTKEAAGSIVSSLTKTSPSDQLKTSSTSTAYYTEGLKNDTTTNAHARDIEAFISSANTKGGYYLGRYEARKNTVGGVTAVTTVASHSVWHSVNQAAASYRSQAMYGDANETKRPFSSDLINSYAWDTAIVFLQEFDDRAEEAKTTPYSSQSSLNGSSVATTGTQGLENAKQDVICNIWDMASNCYEWSTETHSDDDNPSVFRGGLYQSDAYVTGRRANDYRSIYGEARSFRPLLYLAL